MTDVVRLRPKDAPVSAAGASTVRTLATVDAVRVDLEQFHGPARGYAITVTAEPPGKARVSGIVMALPEADDTRFVGPLGDCVAETARIVLDAYEAVPQVIAGRDELTDDVNLWTAQMAVLRVMEQAAEENRCPLAAAEQAFPGIPAGILCQCHAELHARAEDSWLKTLRRHVPADVLAPALDAVRRAAVRAGSR